MKTKLLFFALILGFNFCLGQDFDETKTKILFEKFNEKEKTPFDYKILNEFLKDIKIEELKSGKEIEKELFFENSESNCKDKLKISFDKKSKNFILYVHEETFIEDLGWCSEGLYSYSFQIKNKQIIKVKYKFLAG